MPFNPFRRRGGRKGQAPVNKPVTLTDEQVAGLMPTPEQPKPEKKKGKSSKDERFFAEAAAEQHQRLVQRANWLTRKANQLPLNSNGRKRANAERLVLVQLIGQSFGVQATHMIHATDEEIAETNGVPVEMIEAA